MTSVSSGMTEDFARILAAKLKTGFRAKFTEIYGLSLDEKEITTECVQRYLDSTANIVNVVHDEKEIHVETAPPFDETPMPTLKWVAPMAEIRGYVQNFVPQCPYDLLNDTFISTDYAEKLETQCGAVVYQKKAHAKQLHFLYNCVQNFVESLEGTVLVIGDNGGAIAYRTQFRHTYAMYRGAPDSELLLSAPTGRILFEDEFPKLFQVRHFDHVVCFLKSYPFVFPPGQRVHYLGLISGNGGIMETEIDGEFSVNGKLVTLYPNPIGSVVCHTSLFKVFDPKDHFVVWYTDKMPIEVFSSLTPLTDISRLGPRNDNFISDKCDGEVCYLEIRNHHLSIKDFEMLEIFSMKSVFNDQILVVEKVGSKLIVVEPLYFSGLTTFAEWRNLGNYMNYHWLEFKTWFPYPKDDRWWNFAGSGEGVVIKGGKTLIGSKDFAFRKLATYYLKLPNRVSYEDQVNRIYKDDDSGSALVGHHNVYSDPSGVYQGFGIYEVQVATLTLFRHRPKKKFADPVWYVEAVTSVPNFDKVFTMPLSIVRNDVKQNQGLISMHTVQAHRVDKAHILDSSPEMIAVNFPADLNSVLIYKSKYYIVIVSEEGKSVANKMS